MHFYNHFDIVSSLIKMTDDTKNSDTKNSLSQLYYQPENLWTCRKAEKLLQKASLLLKEQVMKFLGKQALTLLGLAGAQCAPLSYFIL